MNHLEQDKNLLTIIEHANTLMKEIEEYKSETGMTISHVSVTTYCDDFLISVKDIPKELAEQIKIGNDIHCSIRIGNAELFDIYTEEEDGETL